MQVIEVSKEVYASTVKTPFSLFDTVDFCELNKSKVDVVKYFILNDEKDRFAIIGGIKDGVLRFPFSASFGCFSEIVKKNQITYYNKAVKALIEWAKESNISKIKMSLPPSYYNISHLSKIENALFINDFRLETMDVNFEYYLDGFDEKKYEMEIDSKPRQILRGTIRNNLKFAKTDDFETVYEIIKKNRESRGFPLRMTLEEVKNTANIIPSDLFLVCDVNSAPIASALVHHINKDVVRVVYWGNLPESEKTYPMNFIGFSVFKYYSSTDVKIVDIGTSTECSIPNHGLCDFKERIGCKCSTKNTYIYTV